MNNLITVIYFQRKPRPGINFSIENIFENLRRQLSGKINFIVFNSEFYNTGFISKFLNIIQASIRQRKNSISHITGEVHFLNILMRGNKILLTIHDCRFMERKQGYSKKLMNWLYLKAPVKKANLVTVISESTKKEVIKYTNCLESKIIVIPNSIDDIFQPTVKIFNSFKPIILQIGAAPNKNISRLIEAIKNISCSLIIIGDVKKENINQLNDNKIDYVIKKNLSGQELYCEYINCDIVSFVSTYEGFGMPIIEAHCVERPVITSNISSMPEVAGDAACFVNPLDIEDISNGISKIINDEDYRKELIEKGRKNKLRFSSKLIAEKYYSLYKKILND